MAVVSKVRIGNARPEIHGSSIQDTAVIDGYSTSQVVIACASRGERFTDCGP